MKRIYSADTAPKLASIFVGNEVERTPAEGLLTLFVVGIKDVDHLANLTKTRNIKHVYLGANQSCEPTSHDEWLEWDTMASALLDLGYWVTLDIDISLLSKLQECLCATHDKFIPMLSVKFPNIRKCNHNTVVKIDDVGFKATNTGVWCYDLSSLTHFSRHTSWERYDSDEFIE